MELKNLSSNWKKLQETLQKDNPPNPSKVLKRKSSTTSTEILDQRHQSVKRRKAETHTKSVGFTRKSMETRLQGQINGKGDGKANGVGSGSGIGSGKPSASLALWAEDNDIPAADLAEAYGVSVTNTTFLGANGGDKVNEGLSATAEVGRYIAIDCEMVGVGPPPSETSVLARVSVVNYHGQQVYDSFVQPKEYVTDWRTHVSGIAPRHMATARSLEEVQKDISDLLDGRILIGHAIRHDLNALLLGHPKRDIRDTSRHAAFRKLSAGRTPALKKLSKELLGIEIQGGEHSSVEDARACMLLFRRNKDAFEVEHAQKFPMRSKQGVAEGGGTDEKVKRKKKRKGKK
ncbi:MAG: 3'-5' exonuclease [Pycnora praestabilis]|nr:MAG: 3'-5' exonuclease [Pycnora praestabilis]